MNQMVQHNGFWWPADDTHCHSVIHDEEADADLAVAHCCGRTMVVQAGGNCGIWAARLATQFETVHTFEPDAANFECLLRNVPANVVSRRVALGDKPGRVGLTLVPGNAGAHFIAGDGDTEVITIDSLALPACDLMILDIEGYEPFALHGAVETIRRFRPVVMLEEKGLSQKLFGIPRGAAERWLIREFGYRVVARVRKDVILSC